MINDDKVIDPDLIVRSSCKTESSCGVTYISLQ